MASVLELLAAVVATIEVDRDLLAARAGLGFTTSTELADSLVRAHGLPFRTAHAIAARVVQDAIAGGKGPGDVDPAAVDAAARTVTGRPLAIDAGTLRAALDPWAFVRARTVTGGPAPDTVGRALDGEAARLRSDRAWLATARERLVAAERERGQRAERFIGLA
jgi:argininosuccinate lyase